MPPPPLDQNHVLSIQSHVVSGYVGNRAATFPLQMLGYDVDVVNTVQFSNHTGYGHTDGHKTSPEQLAAVFSGLRTNGITDHARVLTGYIPGAEALGIVKREVERIMEREGVVYVLDPVMGDVGTGLYVSPDVVPVYKELLRKATIITPNQFETELLSGIKVTSLPTLHSALLSLHTDYGVPHVVLSSVPLPISLLATLNVPPPPSSYTRLLPASRPPWYDAVGVGAPDDEVLVCFSSSYIDGALETYAFALPTIRGYFSGVGDLFSALVLGHYRRDLVDDPGTHGLCAHDNLDNTADALPPLAHAVSRALLTVQQILLRTHLYSLARGSTGYVDSAAPTPTPRAPNQNQEDSVIPSDVELDDLPPPNPTDPKRKARRMRLREMRVVQERALIVDGGEGWPAARIDWDRLVN